MDSKYFKYYLTFINFFIFLLLFVLKKVLIGKNLYLMGIILGFIILEGAFLLLFYLYTRRLHRNVQFTRNLASVVCD